MKAAEGLLPAAHRAGAAHRRRDTGPRALQEQVTQLLGQNASLVMTNVPGPQHALYFAGRRIVEQDFWVPQSGGIGMGVSILSYDGASSSA
jgi:hypothetical protein